MWDKYDLIRPQVVHCLRTQGFKEPTPIQVQVLQNYKHYYDFLLASQTGSGKTLAFGIPIISELLSFRQQNPENKQLSCLILTPTRQLALQIEEHLNKINPNKTLKLVNVVGGLSKEKQLRLISYCPDIVIATPGRLNQLLQSQQKIINLDNLRYLVIDEADRMVELGHFKEVDNILDSIFNKEVDTYDDVLRREKSRERKSMARVEEPATLSLKKNKKFKFDVNTLQIDQLVQIPIGTFKIFNEEAPQKKEKSKSKSKTQKQPVVQAVQQSLKREPVQPLMPKIIKKKIFLVSATLTREFKDTKYYTKRKDKQEMMKQREQFNSTDQDLAPKLKALISRIKFTSKPRVIDLSSELLIPALLTQYTCYCEEEEEKLAYLLCYLSERMSGGKKIIIFTNTIKVSKRLSEMLTLLRHPNSVLHSFMQQRQRLSKLDNFSKGNKNPILISTDLAARGLDMVIDIVVQYGVPLNGDTYVHRLGRTARAGRTGENLIIISKKEYSRWKEILKVVQGSGAPSHHTYLPETKTVDNYIQDIKVAELAYLNNLGLSKEQNKTWMKKEAEEAEIILDEQKGTSKDQGKDKAKKYIKTIDVPTRVNQLQEKVSMWRKNKFVMDTSDIQAYLSKH